jgi:hypothetical protein
VPRFSKTIMGMAMDLEPGQNWGDEVTLVMSREQAMIAMSSCSVMLRNIMDGLANAADSANDGDIMGILVGPHLERSARDLQGVMRTMAETLLPALIAEVDTRDAAEAEAKKQAIRDFVAATETMMEASKADV